MVSLTLAIPKNRINFSKYILFLSTLQPKFNFDIIFYSSSPEEELKNIKSKYILILKKYCYINFDKLFKLLENDIADTYLSSNEEISIKKTQQTTGTLITKNIDKYCFLSNSGLVDGKYHSSIFVCLDDNDENFFDWLQEYSIKRKIIFYKNANIELKIGKTFFIINGKHIGILPKNKKVYWNNKLNKWIGMKNTKLNF